MNKEHSIEQWRYAHIANELREARKVLNILEHMGNVLVNGGVTALDRICQLIDIFRANGIANGHAITEALEELEQYYPSNPK